MDSLDIGYVVVISIFFLWYIIKNRTHTIAIWLWLFFIVASLDTANRVIGFPGNKWAILEIAIYIAYVILGILILIELKSETIGNKTIAIFLIMLNIYLPVSMLPICLIRNSYVNNTTQQLILKWRPGSFVTKMAKNRITVIQMMRDSSGNKQNHVINYHWDRKNQPIFVQDLTLSPKNKLNQPYAFILKVLSINR